MVKIYRIWGAGDAQTDEEGKSRSITIRLLAVCFKPIVKCKSLAMGFGCRKSQEVVQCSHTKRDFWENFNPRYVMVFLMF